jgi:hypothetical protein
MTLFLFLFTISVYGQDDNCQKLTVGVYFTDLYNDAFKLLNEQYGTKSKLEWRHHIDDIVLENLQGSCPEINFVSNLKNPGIDPDYLFIYFITIIAIDTDIKIPGDSIVYTDPFTGEWWSTEFTDPVYNSEPGFWMFSRLVVNTPCVPILRWIVWCEITEDLELEPAIHENLRGYYRMINVIDEHEARKSAPAREPEMEISLEKDYLSPLDKETRQMELYVKVKDCHGRYVYYPGGSSQPVYYQKETERCEFKSSIKCADGPDIDGFHTVLINKEYRAIGEYHLKRGLEPGTEEVTLKTCGISNRANREEQKTLVIRGLEVEVKPDRREIFVDEGTEITITLNETDLEGNKYPVAGKDIEVHVSGVVNGKITPQGPYTTNENGEVLLTYQAGDRDSRTDITASFQPPNYPDKAEDHASITVNPLEYDATIFLKKKVIKRKYSHKEQSYGSPCKIHEKDDLDFSETIEASVYVTLRSVGSVDMFAFNQRWETYEVTSIHLSNFYLFSRERKEFYHSLTGMNCAVGAYEQIITKNKSLTDRTIGRRSVGSTLVVAFDKDLELAVLILPFGESVGYEYDEEAVREETTWDENGTATKNTYTDTKHEEDAFNVEAVEDEEPYSTSKFWSPQMEDYVKSIRGVDVNDELHITMLAPASKERVSQEKIHPDLMVQFGDGVNYFGGRGNKIINEPIEGGFSYEEQNFLWQMTRKKRDK